MAGSDLIFGHGYEYQDAAIAVAADYPEIVFITSAGASGAIRENVSPIVFRLEQATYLLGMIAGLDDANRQDWYGRWTGTSIG